MTIIRARLTIIGIYGIFEFLIIAGAPLFEGNCNSGHRGRCIIGNDLCRSARGERQRTG